MSKSDADPRTRIDITDGPDVIRTKIQKALTDSHLHLSYEPESRPALANLVDIHSAVSGRDLNEICAELEGLNIVQYKDALAHAINERLQPIRDEVQKLQEDQAYVEGVLQSGAEQAREVATETFSEVQRLVGFR